MKTTVTDPSFFTNPCESYLYVALLPDSLRLEIKKQQDNLASKFGHANFWFPKDDQLHITVAHIVSPDARYEISQRQLYDSVKSQSKLAIEKALSDKQPQAITFDTVAVFDNAIVVQGHDDGLLEDIRKTYTNNFTLPVGTRLPPSIIHTTIARYISPLDLEELQEFAKNNLSIDAAFQIEAIQLVSEKKIFLQDYEILEQYRLGDTSS